METFIALVVIAIIGLCIYWAGGFGNFICWIIGIVLLIMAVILTVKACKTIHYKRIERSNKKREQQSRDNRDKIENNLIQEYAASRELRKALNVILQGNMSNRPSEITISSREIIAIYGNLINNKRVCYDFLENRVEPPAFVDRDSWYQPRPIMAMGWAVIRVLNNDYEMTSYSSGEMVFLELKPDRHF